MFAAAAAIAGTVAAQSYPVKPIRVVDPFPPGGSTDIVARTISPKFHESLGHPWVIENRPGAQGIIGGDFVAKAAPDGYTLLMFSITFVVQPAIYKSLPYDVMRAFVPVMQTSNIPNVLVVHPSVPARNVRELIALAKSTPKRLNFASGAAGLQMTTELFNTMAGTRMTHIPYKGGAPAVLAAVGGEVDLVFATLPTAVSFIRSGRLRALGTCGSSRALTMPELPTIAEAGLPGFEASNAVGVLAPAGTGRDVVTRLQQEISRILGLSDVRERLLAVGIEPAEAKPDQFGEYLRAEVAKWTKLVKTLGMEPQSW